MIHACSKDPKYEITSGFRGKKGMDGKKTKLR